MVLEMIEEAMKPEEPQVEETPSVEEEPTEEMPSENNEEK